MSYSPTTSSPICVANPDQTGAQHYWPQGQILDSSRDALSAYYSPLIYQVIDWSIDLFVILLFKCFVIASHAAI